MVSADSGDFAGGGWNFYATLVTGIPSLIAGALLLLRPVLGTWVMVWSFPLWFITHCIFSLGSLDLVRMTAGPVYYYFSLIINIIGLILGVFMILNPWAAWFSLSDLIGCYLLIVGIEGIVMALGCCQTGASDASVCHINTSQTKEK